MTSIMMWWHGMQGQPVFSLRRYSPNSFGYHKRIVLGLLEVFLRLASRERRWSAVQCQQNLIGSTVAREHDAMLPFADAIL